VSALLGRIERDVMTKTTKEKIIFFSLIIFGILVLIAGIIMVQTGFATFDEDEPRVGLYIGGIFTIIGGVFLTVGGIIFLNFDGLKKKALRTAGKIADAVEEERIQEKK
jgi:Na+/proline symporter